MTVDYRPDGIERYHGTAISYDKFTPSRALVENKFTT